MTPVGYATDKEVSRHSAAKYFRSSTGTRLTLTEVEQKGGRRSCERETCASGGKGDITSETFIGEDVVFVGVPARPNG